MQKLNLLLESKLLKLIALFAFAALMGKLANAQCNAAFGFTVYPTPRTVQFANSSTGTNLTYVWTFGNGDSSYLKNPYYQYTNTGTYTVCLKVKSSTDTLCNSVKCTTVVMPPTTCIANFTWTIDSTVTPWKYNFNGTSSTGNNKQYFWTFGDSSAGSTSAPTHQYLNPGTYTVCLRVRNSQDTTCTNTKCTTIVVPPPPCIIAKISFSVNNTTTPPQYYFSSGGSSTTGNGILYLWEFGDGDTSHAANVTHQFPDSGKYTVCLTAINWSDTSCRQKKCVTVTVTAPGPYPCEAKFSATGYLDTIQKKYVNYFNGTTSKGRNLIYTWSFGNGDTLVGSYHGYTYNTPGSYIVCLKVTSNNDTSCHDKKCSTIVVPGLGCQANFWFWSDTAKRFYFIDYSTGNQLRYHWTFGDGDTSSSQHPQHVYTNAGWFRVCLKVTSLTDSSCNNTRCDSAWIRPNCISTYHYYFDTITQSKTLHFSAHNGRPGTTYKWYFGDGDSSSSQSPGHQYAAAGWYVACLTVHNNTDTCHQTYCDSVYVPGSNGMEESAHTIGGIDLYPNPFSDKLNMRIHSTQSQRAHVSILDIVGKSYLETKIELDQGINRIEYDLRQIPAGVYILQIQTPFQTHTRKIVK